MSQEELNSKYKALEDHILELLIKFIGPHNNPLEQPNSYNLDVHSFCILCHAAFEEFLEDITLFSVDKIDKKFKENPRKYSYSTLCLLHFDENPLSVDDDKKWEGSLNDYLTEKIKSRKSELSTYATQNNHGIDVKYLRKLLVPIGIDVPKNPKYLGSLDKLKSIRGAYAHSFVRNNKPIPPEDAEAIVYDVLEMVEEIKNVAINMPYYKIVK